MGRERDHRKDFKHAQKHCLLLYLSEVIQITIRADWTTDNELVYTQQNKWALQCPFCEAYCYGAVWHETFWY